MKITQPCIIPNMDEKIYHADPCPTPSASRGFINKLIRNTAEEAMLSHPRLNPDYVEDNNKDFDFGGAAHDYMLRGGDKIAVLSFPDYRTNAAKAERDSALSLGKLPILEHKFTTLSEMVEVAHMRINAHADHPNALKDGNPEVGIFWQEDNGIWCRTMPDFVADNGWIYDYKTTDISSPRQWMDSHIIDMGYHIQAFMALRGYKAVTAHDAKGFCFVVQRTTAPFGLYMVELDGTMLEVAESEFELALDIMERCMKTGYWPGYSNKIYTAYPSFKANRAFEDVKEVRLKMEMTADKRAQQHAVYKPKESQGND